MTTATEDVVSTAVLGAGLRWVYSTVQPDDAIVDRHGPTRVLMVAIMAVAVAHSFGTSNRYGEIEPTQSLIRVGLAQGAIAHASQ